MRRESLAMRTDTLKQPTLVVVRVGQTAEVDYPVALGRPVTLGSAQDNTIVVDGLNVAPRHAIVQTQSGQIILEDQQTPNGTTVNGQPVATCSLGPGDVIELGTSRITLVDRAVTPPSPQAAAPGGAAKMIKLGGAALVTAGLMIFVLRLLAPSAPPADSSGSGTAAASGTAAGGPSAPASAPTTTGGPASAASGSAHGGAQAPSGATASAIAPATDSPLVRQVTANAVASGVDPADALFDEGQSQLSAGRLRDASRLFAAVLARQPKHPLAATRLEEARQRLEEAITDAMSEADRSAAQLEYDDAIVMWERVLELAEPGDPRAVRARQGIDEARRHVRR